MEKTRTYVAGVTSVKAENSYLRFKIIYTKNIVSIKLQICNGKQATNLSEIKGDF